MEVSPSFFLFFMLILLNLKARAEINITIIEGAEKLGAVCLDGSPPAYYLDRGFSFGADNWILLLEGGGWCTDERTCAFRTLHDSHNGSDTLSKTLSGFIGLLGNNQTINPEFYNWNRVYVHYCDLGSYTGDIPDVIVAPETSFYLRGSRIFSAIVEDLLSKGMENADNAILSGFSAGGLGALLHCDEFRSKIPAAKRVKCFSDGGYFIRGTDLPGVNDTILERPYMDVVAYHGMEKFLFESCTSRMDSKLCLYPENFVLDIETPVFLLNSAFDSYQLKQKVLPDWKFCGFNYTNCSAIEVQAMRDFRTSLINALPVVNYPSPIGIFVHSCVAHEHLLSDKMWSGSGVPDLKNKTLAQAFGDWYFDRSPFQAIDTSDTPIACHSI